MRILCILICGLALAVASTGAQEQQQGKEKKKGAPAKQGSAQRGTATGKPAQTGHPIQVNKATRQTNRPNQAGKPKTKAPPVKFQQGRHIQRSQKWQGQQYAAFRNYHSAWHDQGWWRSHYPRVTFVFGAPYYWNAGYWYPAWGYTPNAYYAWDGPIYAYNNLPPDQVIANVQASLQQQGYYRGEVDGLLPLTRAAIADYQRDRGLYITSAIDQPTLQSLGMA